MKALGKYLLADNGRASLAALAFALLGLFLPVSFVTAVILGFVTLQKGYKSGLAILAFIALPAVAMGVVLLIKGHGGGAQSYFIYFVQYIIFLVQCVWIFLLALGLYRGLRWHTILEWGALLSVLIIAAIHLFVPHIRAVWEHLLSKYIAAHPSLLTSLHRSAEHMTPDKVTEFIHQSSVILTGTVGFALLFGATILFLLSRWWQTLIFSPGRLQQEFLNIRITRVFSVFFLVVTAVTWSTRAGWLVDLYPVLLLPFLIGGLSLLDCLTIKHKKLLLILLGIYVILLIFSLYMIYLIGLLMILGFIDSVFNLRRHVKWLTK